MSLLLKIEQQTQETCTFDMISLSENQIVPEYRNNTSFYSRIEEVGVPKGGSKQFDQ